ncbi:glycoside hydrolase superfamily [Mycena sanguinolenta]|nr:glycoside hydrolase superfamily [Mycena sanguinolenta]
MQGTVCGPQVPGMVNPGAGANLSTLNLCPLNACCNIWGQCGTTSDFCTPSSTGAPGAATPGTNGCISTCGTEIISSSPPARSCLNMDVRQIDTYTHVHFVFFDITSSFDVDISQYQDSFNDFVGLTGIKCILWATPFTLLTNVFIAGWAMSTDADTYDIFRDAVSTSVNQQTLASNLVAFVNQYKLDSINIDWEYPEEQDIPGIHADITGDGQNLGAFLTVLRPLLPSGITLSIAVPVGYWYL